VAPPERWAVVLGASVGTGAAIARAVARDPGLHVFGVHRGHYADDAKALETEIRALGRRVHLRVGDAGDAEGARAGAAAVREIAGPRSVALVVHSLSGASLGHFLSPPGKALEPRQFEKTFNYLAHSFVYWTRELFELDCLAPSARVLGLTNLLHDSLLNNCGLIAASKAALQMYVRHLALELGPHGHRVNLLKFGSIVTPALARMLGAAGVERLERSMREMIPAGRSCTYEDVGRIVCVLARDEGEWFNGATIDYTGGMTLRLLDIILQPEGGTNGPDRRRP
jgi:NAD(P)-dependent dehydrogenase (short-subunit alcohol dehydrogenase family)